MSLFTTASNSLVNLSNQNHEIISLRASVQALQSKVNRMSFGAGFIEGDDERTCFYTGLPSHSLFVGSFKELEPLVPSKITPSISLVDEFFLTLVKLRLGVPVNDLAYRMNINRSHISQMFHQWIDVMSRELKCLISWPDKQQLDCNMPPAFKKHFSDVVCIIDCFEVFIERPTSLMARALTYSSYKSHNTLKVLIGVAPTLHFCCLGRSCV
jgi:hypothetical protein